MTSATISSRLFARVVARPALLPGLFLALGAVLFLAGGRFHPMINDSIGAMGSDEFYRAFSNHVLMSANWEGIHNLILIGPVLWALGASGVDAILPRGGAPLWAVAKASLAIGATCWIVAFALDGHNAPAFARAIADATDSSTFRDRVFDFSISTRLVAYFGRIGWTMMTLALAAFGIGLLFAPQPNTWKKIVGIGGLLVGAWTMFELLRGDFTPGPFTSPYWMHTALGTGAWVIAFGVTIAAQQQTIHRTAASGPPV